MRILVVGYTGKTGSVIFSYLKKQKHDLYGADLNTPIKERDYEVIIDFSCPKSTLETFAYAVRKKIPCIIGTTGFSEDEKQYIKKVSNANSLPTIMLGNFLPSISLMQKTIAKMSPLFDNIIIEETHHISKVDAPSGTALMLGKMVDDPQKVKYISHRSQNFIYEHKIIFVNKEEKIILNHNLYDKIGYAKGVAKALKNIHKVKGFKERF